MTPAAGPLWQLTSNVFGSVFYLATGFHGLHVTGGLIAFLLLMLYFALFERGLPYRVGRPPADPLDSQQFRYTLSALAGADIMVEATRLTEPAVLLETAWVTQGTTVIPYGTVSAVDLDLVEVMDKVVVDDWGQATVGPLGALRRHVDSGRLGRHNLHAELGQIVAGKAPGRERPEERVLFWHRGLSLSDIALGHALLEKSARTGIGQKLRFA